MVWLNKGIRAKPMSQLINKLNGCLQWYGLDIDLTAAIMAQGRPWAIMAALIMAALGLRPWAIMAALRSISRPYHYKQSLTYK